jgi:hypothetical protein
MAVVYLQNVVPLETLLLDPTYSGGLPWYTGLVSGIGILIWTVGACAAAAGAFVSGLGARSKAARFLAEGAVLALLLTLDDLFLLHGVVGSALGIGKPFDLMFVPGAVMVWAATHQTELGRTRFQLLIAAGFALGCSAGAELLPGGDLGTRLLVEDGAKLLGILAWTTYFVTTANDIVRSVLAEAAARSDYSTPDDAAILSRHERSMAHDS